jgi:hypothetical protein
MKEDSKSSLTMMPKFYRTNCRLGKSKPNPQDGDNGGRVYPLSPQINPPHSLVKDKFKIRGNPG